MLSLCFLQYYTISLNVEHVWNPSTHTMVCFGDLP